MSSDLVCETDKFKCSGKEWQLVGHEKNDSLQAASGVLCDKRTPIRLKGIYYKTIVRPEMLYEFYVLDSEQIIKTEVECIVEMRILYDECCEENER